MNSEEKLIQQGDVLFFQVAELPDNVNAKDSPRPGLVTFAEGEATGHHHSCVVDADAPAVRLYEDDQGTLYCEVDKTAEVTHQEHGTVTLEPGSYRIGIVREVDPFAEEIRSVRD